MIKMLLELKMRIKRNSVMRVRAMIVRVVVIEVKIDMGSKV